MNLPDGYSFSYPPHGYLGDAPSWSKRHILTHAGFGVEIRLCDGKQTRLSAWKLQPNEKVCEQCQTLLAMRMMENLL